VSAIVIYNHDDSMQRNPFGTLRLQPMELEGSATKGGFVSAECEERIRRNVKPASVVTSTAAFATRCVFDKHAHDNKSSE
jgi:hypothetical protein